MRDIDVRRALRETLGRVHGDSESLLLDEVGVCNGVKRVDMAVVNGELTGYEIKSAADTLDRLAAQRDVYNLVFDRVVLVAADRHLDEAEMAVPSWWGIMRAALTAAGEVGLETVRAPGANPQRDGYALARLLWREEALGLLEQHDLADPTLARGSRRHMWRRLADALDTDHLSRHVRQALKTRSGWRDPVGPRG